MKILSYICHVKKNYFNICKEWTHLLRSHRFVLHFQFTSKIADKVHLLFFVLFQVEVDEDPSEVKKDDQDEKTEVQLPVSRFSHCIARELCIQAEYQYCS